MDSFSKLRVDYYNASFNTKKLFLNCTSIKNRYVTAFYVIKEA